MTCDFFFASENFLSNLLISVLKDVLYFFRPVLFNNQYCSYKEQKQIVFI